MNSNKVAHRASLVVLTLLFILTSSIASAADQSGYLGVYLQDLEPSMVKALQLGDKTGVLISDVVDEGPAEEAGLESGDIILAFDGTDTETAKDLTKAVRKSEAGEEVKVVVLRDGKEKTLQVKLGDREVTDYAWTTKTIRKHGEGDDDGETHSYSWTHGSDNPHIEIITSDNMKDFHIDHDAFFVSDDRGFLGIQMEDLNEQLGEYFGVEDGKGVLVKEIVEDSPAEKAGLKAGDVIVKIDGDKVGNGSDLHEALSGTEAEQKVKVEVRRKGDKKSFDVTLGEAPENEFLKHIEIIGEDGQFNVHAPNMKMHFPKHLRHLGKGDDENVFFFKGDGDDERIIIEEHVEDLQSIREEMKDLKKELKKLKEELKN